MEKGKTMSFHNSLAALIATANAATQAEETKVAKAKVARKEAHMAKGGNGAKSFAQVEEALRGERRKEEAEVRREADIAGMSPGQQARVRSADKARAAGTDGGSQRRLAEEAMAEAMDRRFRRSGASEVYRKGANTQAPVKAKVMVQPKAQPKMEASAFVAVEKEVKGESPEEYRARVARADAVKANARRMRKARKARK
tara:strand:- start:12225 stop:12821 length:597 start_codon:yes stop_codon:yes gene_type:complete